jgi:hypothetical protein
LSQSPWRGGRPASVSPLRVSLSTIIKCLLIPDRFGRPFRANFGGSSPRPEGLGCSVVPFHGEDLTHLACRALVLRDNQRNPVTANNTRFRINGQSVPVFSIDRPKQPQSMLKPRRIALSKAPENIVSRIATHTSAPLSHRPSRRLIPTHNSKAGRKTDNTAVAGHGVS